MNLVFYDEDNKRTYKVVGDQLEWNRPAGRKRGGQYYILAEPVDEKLQGKKRFLELWDFTPDFYQMIASHEQPEELGVVIDLGEDSTE